MWNRLISYYDELELSAPTRRCLRNSHPSFCRTRRVLTGALAPLRPRGSLAGSPRMSRCAPADQSQCSDMFSWLLPCPNQAVHSSAGAALASEFPSGTGTHLRLRRSVSPSIPGVDVETRWAPPFSPMYPCKVVDVLHSRVLATATGHCAGVS